MGPVGGRFTVGAALLCGVLALTRTGAWTACQHAVTDLAAPLAGALSGGALSGGDAFASGPHVGMALVVLCVLTLAWQVFGVSAAHVRERAAPRPRC